jgi:hypothetical protein
MILHILHQHAQLALLRRDLLGVVPLQVVGRAVPEVDSLPVGVVPGEEGVVLDLEKTRSWSWPSKRVRVFAQSWTKSAFGICLESATGKEEGEKGVLKVSTGAWPVALIRMLPSITRLRALFRMNVSTG